MLLDTCALLDHALGTPIPGAALAALDRARQAGELLVSSISALEIAQKAATGRLVLESLDPAAWFALALDRLGIVEVGFGALTAFAAYRLPEPFHRDPADRVIVATARLLAVPVVTTDARILAYGRVGHVRTVAY